MLSSFLSFLIDLQKKKKMKTKYPASSNILEAPVKMVFKIYSPGTKLETIILESHY
jgi:hypothetical protein